MDQLLALLQQSLGSVIDDVRATRAMESDIVAAMEARVRAEESRADYRAFCEEVDAIWESHDA